MFLLVTNKETKKNMDENLHLYQQNNSTENKSLEEKSLKHGEFQLLLPLYVFNYSEMANSISNSIIKMNIFARP